MPRLYSSTSTETTLASSLGGLVTDTTMVVSSGTAAALLGGVTLGTGNTFGVALDPDTANEEIVFITANSGDTFTIDRAEAGSSVKTHAAGAVVQHVMSSDDLNWFNNMIQSANTIGNTPTIDGGTP